MIHHMEIFLKYQLICGSGVLYIYKQHIFNYEIVS